jgi:phage major head subunit gpT-like protein
MTFLEKQMALSREEIEKMDATYTSKFETVLSTQTNRSIMKIVLPDTFGAGGYVPYLMGAISSGREWVGSRLFKSLKTYGVRFTGKKYENTIEVQVDDINDDPALGASKIAAAVAGTIPLHTEKQVISVLASNAQGFDGAALFGDHTYSTEVGAPVYNNDITAAAGQEGPTWYVCNDKSVVVATSPGRRYSVQSIHGPCIGLRCGAA